MKAYADFPIDQLDQIFISFSSAATEPDWNTLRVAVDMVDYYTRRIEEFLRRQQDLSTADETWHGEEAILVSLPALHRGFHVSGLDLTALRSSSSER